MIKRIKNILEQIIIKSPILMNPSLSGIEKLFREVRREYPTTPEVKLRFVIDLNTGDYYIASGRDYVHQEIELEFKLNELDCVEGGLYSSGYIWFRKQNLLRDNVLEDPISLFKKTSLYGAVESIVNKIEYE